MLFETKFSNKFILSEIGAYIRIFNIYFDKYYNEWYNKVHGFLRERSEQTLIKVKVRNLTKIFGKKKQQALKMVKEQKSKTEILEKTGATVGVYDVSFDVNEGEIFVIMGLSGSGKSTLVRLLNRLIEPNEGLIEIDGKDVAKMGKLELREVRRYKINMVFQNFGLFPHRTILENVEYGLEVRGVAKEERQKKAEEALENSGLLAFKDQYPHQLSGGMQQRVGLARALANDPEILLMDEAFSALDPLIRKDMQDDLLELHSNVKKTIIFITHDLNEALRIGDRIAIMKDGEIMQIGTGEEILTNPANQYIKDFIEDVDRTKILTAQSIMVPPVSMNIETTDGPNVAFNRIKKEDVDIMIAVNSEKNVKGYLSLESILKARKEKLSLKDVVNKNIITIEKDTKVSQIFNLIYDSVAPLAVVENNKLKGAILKRNVLEALADDIEDEVLDELNQKTKGGEINA